MALSTVQKTSHVFGLSLVGGYGASSCTELFFWHVVLMSCHLVSHSNHPHLKPIEFTRNLVNLIGGKFVL